MVSNIGIGIWEYSVAISSSTEVINVKSCACSAIIVLNKITNPLHKLLHHVYSNGAKGPETGPLAPFEKRAWPKSKTVSKSMSRTTTFLGNFHDDTVWYLQATTLYRVKKCKNIIAGLDQIVRGARSAFGGSGPSVTLKIHLHAQGENSSMKLI